LDFIHYLNLEKKHDVSEAEPASKMQCSLNIYMINKVQNKQAVSKVFAFRPDHRLYPTYISWFSLVPPGKCWDSSTYYGFLPDPFKCTVHYTYYHLPQHVKSRRLSKY